MSKETQVLNEPPRYVNLIWKTETELNDYIITAQAHNVPHFSWIPARKVQALMFFLSNSNVFQTSDGFKHVDDKQSLCVAECEHNKTFSFICILMQTRPKR